MDIKTRLKPMADELKDWRMKNGDEGLVVLEHQTYDLIIQAELSCWEEVEGVNYYSVLMFEGTGYSPVREVREDKIIFYEDDLLMEDVVHLIANDLRYRTGLGDVRSLRLVEEIENRMRKYDNE